MTLREFLEVTGAPLRSIAVFKTEAGIGHLFIRCFDIASDELYWSGVGWSVADAMLSDHLKAIDGWGDRLKPGEGEVHRLDEPPPERSAIGGSGAELPYPPPERGSTPITFVTPESLDLETSLVAAFGAQLSRLTEKDARRVLGYLMARYGGTP